jgi:hypothetical protein
VTRSAKGVAERSSGATCPAPESAAGDRVAEIEQHWGELVGQEEFEQACRVLARLLAQLTAAEAATAPGGPQ